MKYFIGQKVYMGCDDAAYGEVFRYTDGYYWVWDRERRRSYRCSEEMIRE